MLGCCLQILTSQLVPAFVLCPDVWEWGWLLDSWPGGSFRTAAAAWAVGVSPSGSSLLYSSRQCLKQTSIQYTFPWSCPWVFYCQSPPAAPSLFSTFCHQLFFSYLIVTFLFSAYSNRVTLFIILRRDENENPTMFSCTVFWWIIGNWRNWVNYPYYACVPYNLAPLCWASGKNHELLLCSKNSQWRRV